MKEYETVIIAHPGLSEADQAKINGRIASQIDKHEGRLFFARNMGKKTLSYAIRKQTKGIYTCFDYAANGTAVSEIERGLKFDENVLRFLTVVKKADVDVEARAAEVVARGEDVAPPSNETHEKEKTLKDEDSDIDADSDEDVER